MNKRYSGFFNFQFHKGTHDQQLGNGRLEVCVVVQWLDNCQRHDGAISSGSLRDWICAVPLEDTADRLVSGVICRNRGGNHAGGHRRRNCSNKTSGREEGNRDEESTRIVTISHGNGCGECE
jgi:hypothetical protein